MSALSLSDLLKKMTEMGSSDLHLTTNSPPQVRVDGHLRPLTEFQPLTASDTKQLAYSVLTDTQKHRFEEQLEIDFSFGIKGSLDFAVTSSISAALLARSFVPFLMKCWSFDTLNLPRF